MLLIWNLFTYCKSLVELKNINVIQGQSSPFQDFRCAVRWPGMKKIKLKKKTNMFIDQPWSTFDTNPPTTLLKAWTLTPEAADLWGPETRKENL